MRGWHLYGCCREDWWNSPSTATRQTRLLHERDLGDCISCLTAPIDDGAARVPVGTIFVSYALLATVIGLWR